MDSHRSTNWGSWTPSWAGPRPEGAMTVNCPMLARIARYIWLSCLMGFTHIRDTLFNVTNRNVTFNLPVDLMRQAKIYAAEHDTTVNAVVRELLQERVSTEA